MTTAPVLDAKGAPIQFKKVQGEQHPNEKLSATQEFVDTLADARRILDQDPSAINRTEWAAMTSRIERGKTKFIKIVGAKPSSREMGAVEDMFGTNFDSFVSRLKDKNTSKAHIDVLIDGALNDAVTESRGEAGLKLKRKGNSVVDEHGQTILLDTSRPTPTGDQKVDSIVRTLKTPLSEISDEALTPSDMRFLTVSDLGSKKLQRSSNLSVAPQDDPVANHALQLGIPPVHLKAFAELRDMALSDDPKDRAAALGALQSQVLHGDSTAIRDYARGQLVNIGAANPNLMPDISKALGER